MREEKDMRLLFAEDEYYTRTGLHKMCPWEACGIHEVLVAKDGREAMALLEKHPDILLTDIRMPFVDGVTLAQAAREQDSAMSILMLTSYSDKEYLKAAISLSIVAYLEKPVDMDALKNAIQEATRRREQQLRLQVLERAEAMDAPYPPDVATLHPVQAALKYLHAHYPDQDLSLEKVAQSVHLSSDYLSSLFKENLGVSLKKILTEIRMAHAKHELLHTNNSIQEIALHVGYAGSNYFAKTFRKEIGETPTEFREKGAQP